MQAAQHTSPPPYNSHSFKKSAARAQTPLPPSSHRHSRSHRARGPAAAALAVLLYINVESFEGDTGRGYEHRQVQLAL